MAKVKSTKKAKKPFDQTFKKPPKGAGFWQVFWYLITIASVRNRIWQRVGYALMAIIIFGTAGMYGLSQYYIYKHSKTPLTVGTTFISNYARYYDLDPKETLTAILDDLQIKRLRLVSYWSDIEREQGTYDFSELDWQMEMAQERGVEVSLAIGLRQPRWPECHMPVWASEMPGNSWYNSLFNFMTVTVNRYKDHPSLHSYQLENEYFLDVFGICPDFSRDRLVSEFNLVKNLDKNTPVVISMSNNAIGTPIGEPTPDIWAISVYKRVWDKTVSRRYFEYPIPDWYYGFRAGWTEMTRGHDVFMHELQAEPWVPDKYNGIKDAPLEEQDKSINAERLRDRIRYGEGTGMRTMDLWGSEWWYWRKTVHGDDSLWNVVKEELHRIEDKNAQL